MKVIEIPQGCEAKSSPEQWDAKFEVLFRKGSTITTAEGFFNVVLHEKRLINNAMNYDSDLREYAELKRNLCGLQYGVSVMTVDYIIKWDMVNRWLSASDSVRRKHVLIGIAGACAISPNLNKTRLCCVKELRVAYLSSDGQILLDLLNAITPQDMSEIQSEPLYVKCYEWDCMQTAHLDSQDELEKLTIAHILVLRTTLITYALRFIIDSFLGLELPVVPVKKEERVSETNVPQVLGQLEYRARIQTHGREYADKMMAESKAAHQDRKASKVACCTQCCKIEKTREGFKKCAVCSKFGRTVLYCSRDCQVANWKTEHKLICGKPLDYEKATKLATMVPKIGNQSGFPPPAPGFKRPLELLVQLQRLSKYPGSDYAVSRSVYENNDPTAMIFFSDPVHKALFRAHRNRAMITGDMNSIALICEYILWSIEVQKAKDFEREKVVEQMSREYGWTVNGLEDTLEVLAELRECHPDHLPALVYGHYLSDDELVFD